MRVYIPWRDSCCPWRSKSLDYVTRWWRDRGHTVRLVDAGGERFSRAATRNCAVDMAGGGVICIADADMLCDSIDVEYKGGLHLPYTRYNALSQTSTFLRYNGIINDNVIEFNDSQSVAGIMIVDCDVWRDAGGMCTDFVGWGFEDTEFATRIEIHRTEGDAYHLWHPPGFVFGSDEYNANKELYLSRVGDK